MPTPSGKKVVLFVHGLGGDPDRTWRGNAQTPSLPELVRNDPVLGAEYDVSLYGFPSSPFSAPPVASIVDGLRTHILHRCAGFDEIALVAHSLGGLIAQKYVVEELTAGRPLRVKKLILYAVPNDGSSLAKVGDLLPWHNRQLNALCRSSDLIEQLTQDWIRLEVTRTVAVTYVTAGQDAAVARDSSRRLWDAADREELPGRGHVDLVKPTDANDLAFVILRSVLDERRTGKVMLVLSHEQEQWRGYKNVADRLSIDALKTGLLASKREVARASVLILAIPYHREFDPQEIEFLKSWVWKGGGLFLLGYYASRHHFTHINTLANPLDLEFGEDMIVPAGIDSDGCIDSVFNNDPRYGLDLDLAGAGSHPLLDGVAGVKLFSASSVRDSAPANEALAIASVSATARFCPQGADVNGYLPVIKGWIEDTRGPMPALVACQRGKGRVVAVGTWKICTADIADNRKLVNNVIGWLKGT